MSDPWITEKGVIDYGMLARKVRGMLGDRVQMTPGPAFTGRFPVIFNPRTGCWMVAKKGEVLHNEIETFMRAMGQGPKATPKVKKDTTITFIEHEALDPLPTFPETPRPGILPLPEARGIDLKSGLVIPLTADMCFTAAITTDYVPNACADDFRIAQRNSRCEHYQSLLLHVSHGLDVGTDKPHVIWLYGDAGCGKSTFAQLVGRMFGPALTLSTTLKKLATSRFETIRLRGKALVVINDVPTDEVGAASDVLKQLAGNGDTPLSGESKGVDGVDFVFKGLVIVTSNEMPNMEFVDDAVARRLAVFKFEAPLVEDNDPTFREYMERSAEAPRALLTELVDYAIGKVVPDDGYDRVVETATVLADMDPMSQFFDDLESGRFVLNVSRFDQITGSQLAREYDKARRNEGHRGGPSAVGLVRKKACARFGFRQHGKNIFIGDKETFERWKAHKDARIAARGNNPFKQDFEGEF